MCWMIDCELRLARFSERRPNYCQPLCTFLLNLFFFLGGGGDGKHSITLQGLFPGSVP